MYPHYGSRVAPVPHGTRWCTQSHFISQPVGPYVLVSAPAGMHSHEPLPAPLVQRLQTCSGGAFDEISDHDLAKYIAIKEKAFNIPEWLRVNAQTSDRSKLERYIHDLSIAPFEHELKKLNDRELDRYINALENQNGISEVRNMNLNNTDEKIAYACRLIPRPVFQDMARMSKDQLVASIIKMHRLLCMPLAKRGDFESFDMHKLFLGAKKLLQMVPIEPFPGKCRIDDFFVQRFISAIRLPHSNQREIIRSLEHAKTSVEKYDIIKRLKNSYHFTMFHSRTCSKNDVRYWRPFICAADVRYAIELQTGIANGNPERRLFLTTCKRYPVLPKQEVDMDTRFWLETSLNGGTFTHKNVTQFMQVEYPYTIINEKTNQKEIYFVLRVYDPEEEILRNTEDSEKTKMYFIPCWRTTDKPQEEKLNFFLENCTTKIGRSKEEIDLFRPKYKTQIYRALDPTAKLKSYTTVLALHEALEGNSDVIQKIMQNV
jgi:hypothetical protein